MSSILAAGVMAWAADISASQAALVLMGTRVVYPSNAKDVTIRAVNNGAIPMLAQVWVDDGRVSVLPSEMAVPFIVSPAIARIDPSSSIVIRLMYNKTHLPDDRESLFYLNVLESAPSSNATAAAGFSFRTRIKLFFRPAGLPSEVEDAPEPLTWRTTGRAADTALEVKNPTPYHVSFASIKALINQKATLIGNGMVAPYSSEYFKLPKGVQLPGHARIQYTIITDYGAQITLERPLSN
ncbi:fimbria/pilus periplasmic chaperone [Achromobacter seleniivolatilans]|uniref:Fimbria/pilus periplasmic chaperone n=1 Tax=Achromobacter seleniivolatilans TaxID=3047478 RepID=A0ABY9LWL3_9BURK|nr:fimbria/pilus periplasmic chaperone [Achromobacter sp. R39]WMD19070.1 fimbria/pilus periplasmic chaperone [Achromobacter sp. R39]